MEMDYLFIILCTIMCFVLVAYGWILIKNRHKMYEYIENKMQNSIDSILYDAPTEDDKIGYKDYATALSNQIRLNYNFMVYGIYGPWGSGKTSLMKMIKKDLADENTIWFDAWKYKGKVSIFEALCQVMANSLGEEGRFESCLRLGSNNDKKSNDLRLKIYQIRKFEQNINLLINYVNKDKKKIVVFVDDLDRCDAGSAIDFLENLKVFFAIPNLSFVIGVNYEVLLQEIRKKYDNSKERESTYSREYLAKIINVPFYIPNLDTDAIDNYIKDNIDDERIKLASRVFAIGNDGNLRSVKRIINSYRILLDVARNRGFNIDYVLLAKVLVIQHRYRDLYIKMVYDPSFLYRLQGETNYRGRFARRDNSERKIPEELQQILEIKPLFDEKDAKKYILFLQKESFMDISNSDDADRIMELLRKEQFGSVRTLAYLSKNAVLPIIDILIAEYSKCTYDNKLNILLLMGTSPIFTEEINSFYINDVLRGDDYSLRLEAVEILIRRGRRIEEYIRDVSENLVAIKGDEQEYIMKLAIVLLNHGKKYAVDLIQKMVDGSGTQVFAYSSGKELVEALRKSKDKKALDILELCFETNDEALIIAAIIAIGELDVDSLMRFYNRFAYDEKYKNVFFNAIINNATISSNIVMQIDIDDVINTIELEKSVDNKMAEIRLLQLIVKRYINYLYNDSFAWSDDSIDVKMQKTYDLLYKLSRHDNNWEVRDLADVAYNDIKKYEKKMLS